MGRCETALALADASTLLMAPGRLCENGRPVPVEDPEWIRYTQEMYEAAQVRGEHMDRRELLGIMGLAVFADFHAEAAGSSPPAMEQAARTTTPASVREPFVGIYRLAVYPPHGDNPIGRIQYDHAGRMWAMLHPPGRPPLPGNPTVADYQAMQRGLVAYFGSFDVDEATRRVIHHVEAASDPRWIGTDFVRWYRFEGNRLILSLNAEFTSTLTWERLPEK